MGGMKKKNTPLGGRKGRKWGGQPHRARPLMGRSLQDWNGGKRTVRVGTTGKKKTVYGNGRLKAKCKLREHGQGSLKTDHLRGGVFKK